MRTSFVRPPFRFRIQRATGTLRRPMAITRSGQGGWRCCGCSRSSVSAVGGSQTLSACSGL